MLGREREKKILEFFNYVSKPYRYARKFPSGTLMKKVSFVSKPYRYARKFEEIPMLTVSDLVSKPYRYARKPFKEQIQKVLDE